MKIAVIRVRGSLGVKSDVVRTMNELHLTRKNHCVLIDEHSSLKGMLLKTRDYCTWGEVSDETVALLEKKKGKQKVFRLAPPVKGWKGGIKKHFPKGALGYRGDKINDLIKSMLG